MATRLPTLAAMAIFLLVRAAPAAEPATQPATAPAALAPGDHLRRFEIDGRTRSYLVHVPPKFDPRRPTPVVLVYHGAGMNARTMVWFCGMNRKSDDAGFVAIYPNGTGIGEAMLTFNAWAAPGPGPGGRPDDVAFTARILDELSASMAVDPKRIYATGMSNGGFMCYRLAAELSNRIAAIAPVAGTLGFTQSKPTRPVPVLHFHGSADTIVPFDGPSPRLPKILPVSSVNDAIQMWVKHNGCPPAPTITDLPDSVEDGTTVQRQVYGPGRDGSEVVLYLIKGGGHTWPGQVPPVQFIGKSTRDISANDLIWEFFTRHPMK